MSVVKVSRKTKMEKTAVRGEDGGLFETKLDVPKKREYKGMGAKVTDHRNTHKHATKKLRERKLGIGDKITGRRR